LGRRSGLPVSVSLIASRGAEGPLVQAAIDLQEHALPPPTAPAPPAAPAAPGTEQVI
jgi:hypothetical protein